MGLAYSLNAPLLPDRSMAKTPSSTGSDAPAPQRIRLDPFHAVLGAFFLILAWVLPVAMPALDGRLNVLHYLGMAVCALLSAFFFWRWLRAVLLHAMRNEQEEEVARVRSTTFAQTTPSDKASS